MFYDFLPGPLQDFIDSALFFSTEAERQSKTNFDFEPRSFGIITETHATCCSSSCFLLLL